MCGGYFTKPRDKVMNLSQGRFLTPEQSIRMTIVKLRGENINTGPKPGAALSPRERELLRLLCQGMPYLQVQQVMGVSRSTAAKHRERIGIKTGSVNSVQLGVWAARNGVIP